MTLLERIGAAAVIEHAVLIIILGTVGWWGRALIARLLSGQSLWPWAKR